MIRPGSTKMIAESVPAAEAIVWTMLFSWIVLSEKALSSAIEITGMASVASIRPAVAGDH